MKLLIVESPSKTKTIKKYLGSDYQVTSSVGHIRDLPKNNKKAIEIENNYRPHYIVIENKKDVIDNLKKISQKAKIIYLATDPDREGEAIAWHIAQILKIKDKKRLQRIVFHEITPEAIKQALNHPRSIDKKLVKAQEARRVLDRLFGYDLSGLIWKKVRYGLSAGRVQSPALRILVERERAIRAFRPEKYWVLTAKVKSFKNKSSLPFVLSCSKEIKDKKELNHILKLAPQKKWIVDNITHRQVKKNPYPPFTTSTLQQSASSQLGLSPSQTMFYAQKLYEAGYITYMRTDSVTLSHKAQKQIGSLIKKEFGEKYLDLKQFKNRSKNAQEAHEAIRPSNFNLKNLGKNKTEKKLYQLIWQRAVASQMSPAQIQQSKIKVNVGEKKDKIPYFFVNGSHIVFDGWFILNSSFKKIEEKIPPVDKNEKLKLLKINQEEKETTPPPRYSEAGLVKELEKRGIGRPSTYASIIRTLHTRGYTEKEGRSLKPTEMGEIVSTFLEKNFTKYISDSFTAKLENQLDEIAKGKMKYTEVLDNFYQHFNQDIKRKEKIPKITNLGPADAKFKCPLCKGPMIIKLGKNGKFLSCAKFPECKGMRTVEGKIIEEPKETGEICPECGSPLIEREGRYGKFIACSNYPQCKYIKKDPQEEKKKSTGIKCPLCKKGELIEKNGRYGKFYACSNYPQCKYTIKAKPTGKKCPLCGSLMMKGTKTIPERCSNKNCPNYRPDKLKK